MLYLFSIGEQTPQGGVDQENVANGNNFRQFVMNDGENLLQFFFLA